MTTLHITDLAIEYRMRTHCVRALDGATLRAEPGEVVGIVGESGSGKSTLGLAVGRLLPPNAARVSGDIEIDGRSLWDRSTGELRSMRSNALGFVFQSPMSSLDPTMRVGRQLAMTLSRHRLPVDVPAHLSRAGLPDPERVARSFPHELSGGMAQRVAVALALAHRPQLIVADEPTASLDSTIRAHVLGVIVDHVRSTGATLLLLSHDLHTIRRQCDRVVVMYGGRVVEDGAVGPVLDRSTHPYTKALLAAAPGLEHAGTRIEAIDGAPPVLRGASVGCAFAPRCCWTSDSCTSSRPESKLVDGSTVLCHRAGEAALHG